MLQENLMNLMRQVSTPSTGGGCCCHGNACEGLECLCRPRYFAGQLLTDEDLNRLDHYIVAKDRLHNRYLHGTGVVCGLEVVCQPCDNDITVRSGYALGPCGEDIVVCHDTTVSVTDLLKEFRAQKTKNPCDPYGGRPSTDCDAAEQEWILAVCYQEKPSRGVTSLRQPKKTSCGCGCGGSSSGGGCGCGGSSKHSATATTTSNGSCGCATRTSTPAQCQPTLTCEGYTFKLIKPKKEPSRDTTALTELLSRSELARKVFACLMSLVTQISQLPASPTPQQLSDLCCRLKGELQEILDTGNVHDCLLGQRLFDIVCPNVNDPQFSQKVANAITALLQIAIELFKSCVCSAMLPPCSVGSPDDCVPLATLTIRASDQKVVYICNWSARKFAVTMPMLGYWLDWIPVFDNLRKSIVKLCCTRTRTPRFQVNDKLHVEMAPQAGFAAMNVEGAVGQPPNEVPVEEENATAFKNLTVQYARRTNPLSGLEATVLAGLGLKDTNEQPIASETEIMNPFAALALTHLAGPAGQAVVPDQISAALGNLLGRDAGSPQTPAPSVNEDRMAKLEAAVADLQKTVATQRQTIATLRKGKGNG
jgi:hypothetical protein